MGKFDQRLGPVALGDAFVIELDLQQASGAPWTPTASDASFMGKHAVADDDADAVISEVLGQGVSIVGSKASVRVEPSDQLGISATTTLQWSFRVTTAADGPTTVAAGTLLLERFAVRH